MAESDKNNNVLLFSSRSINFREKHLLADLRSLIPHSKKEQKLDPKSKLTDINEISEMRNCQNVLFLEAKRDFSLVWLSKSPNGPSVKFSLQNVTTMGELKLSGNCLKGSRPILKFDKIFDDHQHLKLMKELLVQTFSTPKNHSQSKPFFDHVISFSFLDKRIWFRNYQFVFDENVKDKISSLVEIGPRFVLKPERIFSGSFYGATLWQVKKDDLKKIAQLKEAKAFRIRKKSKAKTKKYKKEAILPKNELDSIFD
ncbi:Ribosome biogenesis protein BRX1 [Bonamia ostreae]|uniref:Ribosome biogenesis protein BRX1 n=1 Tax=Bonamia ostreae TaxID=126728 RepID=A0ABV2AME7_9EUKA